MSKVLGVRVPDEVYNFYIELAKRRMERLSVQLRTAILNHKQECEEIEASYQKDE